MCKVSHSHPKGPNLLLAPEKGRTSPGMEGSSCLAPAGHGAHSGWHCPPPNSAPEADLCQDPCPAKDKQMKGACVSSLKKERRGAWVAQSVERPTSAQVMISQLVGSNPASGSVLTAQSLEPASDSVSPSLSAPSPPMLCLSLSLSQEGKSTMPVSLGPGVGQGSQSLF